MSTVSFNRQIKVTDKGAQELSRILSHKSVAKKSSVKCRKATKEEMRQLLGVKK